MSNPRLAEGYEPDFDIDYRSGREAEVYVSDIIRSLHDGTAEVKRDDRAQQTGNVYIEFACLRRGEWTPSGVRTSKALVWVFVIGGLAIAAPTAAVNKVAAKYASDPKYRVEMTRGSHPTRGVKLPLGLYLAEVQRNHQPSLLTTPSLVS